MKKITLLFSLLFVISLNDSKAQCGNAVDLDGTNECLTSPFNDYTFTNFTLECWINVASYGSNVHYISLYKNVYLVLGDWGSGSFDTWADGLSPISATSSLIGSANTWHHVAFVYDGTNQKLYIDGVLDVTAATTGTVTHNNVGFNTGLVVGARYDQSTQYVDGLIDELRIWNVARNTTEIQTSMNTSLTGSESGLIAYYQFEDGTGSSIVTDLTGNGNTLTLTNMETNLDWVNSMDFNSPVPDLSSLSDLVGCTEVIPSIPTATDNCTGVINGIPDVAFPITTIGTSFINWSYDDGNGNTSIQTQQVTVYAPVDITTSLNAEGVTITANDISAIGYQWIDCDNANAIIVGEINQSFTATTNGNYAVVVFGSFCSDTSACVNIVSTGIDEIDNIQINLYPNPSNDGTFKINYDGEIKSIQVFDLIGREIIVPVDLNNKNVDGSTISSGRYTVKIITENQKEVNEQLLISK